MDPYKIFMRMGMVIGIRKKRVGQSNVDVDFRINYFILFFVSLWC